MKKFWLLLIALVITFTYAAQTSGNNKPEQISKQKTTEKKKKIPPTPLLISQGYELTIEPLNGDMLIGESEMLFTAGISANFKNWNLNKPTIATRETELEVYETNGDGTFLQFFSSLSDLSNEVVTQEQIINVCTMHHEWLRQGGAMNLFLIRLNGAYLVVNISIKTNGLAATVNTLGGSKIFAGKEKHHIFIPRK